MKKLAGLILLSLLFIPNIANADEDEFYENLRSCFPYNAYYPENGAGKIILGKDGENCTVNVINYPNKNYICSLSSDDIEKSIAAFEEGDMKNRAIIIKRKDGTIGKYNGWSSSMVFWNELINYSTSCKINNK